ncbi:alpha/beta hydrolase [Paenibacillus sp. SYP-B3998]|uniref:Alpha/beta hydrolase n=1 Tax=Paenibacillus sp. SYP-B3998 TaxID=2678564 RepID=A0A6G3ZYQ8_9BACL|nr:alpha/beta hydrolase [Paenibacillus sp. SYP-B3998]NEW06537.1 alpha/beta hydrolase [Paenibacillus sp. SYP-B3998]
MQKQHFVWKDSQHIDIYVYEWLPDPQKPIKAIVQIAHGMSETAARYERLAAVLTAQGYAVYANDHLGHGLTAGTPEQVGKFGKDCFHRMVQNMGGITGHLRSLYSEDVPLFLLGHSMGSFLTQHYMVSYVNKYPLHVQGIILSGSNGEEGGSLQAGIAVASLEAALRGDHHRSKLITALSFGAFNKKHAPNRTPSDWLSRDPKEVDAYEADPFCGVVFTSGYFRDFFKGLKEIHRPEHVNQVRKDLPVFVLSGDDDPVGGYGKGVRKLIAMYKSLGLKDVSSKIYAGGRHEMLNEVNRDEVMQDILGWLEKQVNK